MLIQLDIHNIALIDKVSIEFGKGLNILTGETGAGKSIIIDSINAILGGRVSKDIIRTGKEKAVVEAVFKIDDERLGDLLDSYGIDAEEDGVLVMSREFSISGRNICRVNGKIATVSMLKEIGERIIDIHGQHDNQSLLRTESHIELLDSFAGDSIGILKQEYSKILVQYKSIKSKLKELSGNTGERERKIDLLKFQIDEIKKARLKPGEDDELNRKKTLLSSAEKIAGTLSTVYDLLFGGSSEGNAASDNISQALSELNTISRLDEKFSSISGKLEDLSYQLEDIIEEVRKERDNNEFSPELLERVDERIDLIFRLKRKYGANIDDIISYCRKNEQELDEIIGSEELICSLHEQLEKMDGKLLDMAEGIHSERKKAAGILEEKICSELNDLEMKRAQFKVDLEYYDSEDSSGERKYFHNGLDRVEFLISPNAGEPLKPLSKIASGGEMSRIMLGIKNILADVDKIPTMIFDEIDIGISGRAAQKVGEKLSLISQKHQVICITHLAQIACMADRNYLIEKVSDEESTYTCVKQLTGNKLSEEIARILGGTSISEITLKHAEEMLLNAQKFKKV